MPRMTSMLMGGIVVSLAVTAGAAGPSSISDAAMRGDRASVLALIKQGADVNAPQGDGVTALHWAARSADADLVKALVAAGANANARDGVRRLYPAAPRGRARRGADRLGARRRRRAGRRQDQHRRDAADVRRRAPATPPSIAALLDAGANVNAEETDRLQTPLIFAAASDRVDAVKLLIARGANPNHATRLTDLVGAQQERREPRRPQPRDAERQPPPAGEDPDARRRAPAHVQRAGGVAGRDDAAALRHSPGQHRGGARAARRRRVGEPAQGRRQRVGAARRDRERPVRSRRHRCSTAAPTRTSPPRTASRRSTPRST